MINEIYQLVSPRSIAVKFEEIEIGSKVLVRPLRMAICHADQRYFQGARDPKVMKRKLPMALIHECSGEVLFDPNGYLERGERVVVIPNVPGDASAEIFENYAEGSGFLSSGLDGFMREVVAISADRVIPCKGVDDLIAPITEFVSVAVHAVDRFDRAAHSERSSIGIVGDGSLAYVLACVLDVLLPETRLTIVGHNREKLSLFSFAPDQYMEDEIPESCRFDHVFECAGGEGSISAISTAIEHMRPQGALMLMGVSERPVPVFTRNVLEKGLTLVGCSRSGRLDFEKALSVMRDPTTALRLRKIVYEAGSVASIADIKAVFGVDLETPFKTVFSWAV